ncbi:hypothetical protein CHUAL_002975 [Chamberlinius hualienensis]
MKLVYHYKLLWTLTISAVACLLYGYELYNIEDYVCCNGQLHNRTNSSFDFDCYGSNLCNFRTHRCCGSEQFTIEEAEDYRCCSTDSYQNDQFYNFRTQICCNGEVIDLPTSTSNKTDILYYCCENQVYNPSINACCSGKITPKEEGIDCCGEEKFNVTTEMCCTEQRWLNNTVISAVVSYDSQRPFCCGLQPYNYEEEICCRNKAWRYPKNYNKKYNRMQCCGDRLLYDHYRYLCCADKLVRKPSSTSHCCGGQIYNYRTQTCCGNKMFNHQPSRHIRCCRNSGQLYDDRTQVCCDNTDVRNFTEKDFSENRLHCC